MSRQRETSEISPENQAVLNDRAFFGHPKGVGALAILLHGRLSMQYWYIIYMRHIQRGLALQRDRQRP